jgi:hypothetical protein
MTPQEKRLTAFMNRISMVTLADVLRIFGAGLAFGIALGLKFGAHA